MVVCTDSRDQRKNKKIALERLKKKILENNHGKLKDKIGEEFKKQNSNKGKRGDFTRNYNFQRDEVKQDGEKFSLKKFLRGDLTAMYKR